MPTKIFKPFVFYCYYCNNNNRKQRVYNIGEWLKFRPTIFLPIRYIEFSSETPASACPAGARSVGNVSSYDKRTEEQSVTNGRTKPLECPRSDIIPVLKDSHPIPGFLRIHDALMLFIEVFLTCLSINKSKTIIS